MKSTGYPDWRTTAAVAMAVLVANFIKPSFLQISGNDCLAPQFRPFGLSCGDPESRHSFTWIQHLLKWLARDHATLPFDAGWIEPAQVQPG